MKAHRLHFADDLCKKLIDDIKITPDAKIKTAENVTIRKRGNCIFVMNFTDSETQVELDSTYKNIITGEEMSGTVTLGVCGYLVLKEA